MIEEDLRVKVAVLEEKLKGAEKALELAQSNTHEIIAEILAVIAIIVSMFAIFKR